MPITRSMSDARARARLRLAGGDIGVPPVYPSTELRLLGKDITITADHLGREVMVIPDAVARYMQTHIVDGWREFTGLATGVSRVFGSSTYMYWLTETIVETYAGSDLPDGLDEDDRWRAEQDREYAAQYGGHCYASVLGTSDWDADRRTWRDYAANRDLHLSGRPEPDRRLGCPAYRWAG